MPYLESEFRARTRIDHSLKLLQKYADLERWSGDLEEHLLESAAKTVEFDPRGCTSSAPWMYDDEGHPLTYEQLKEVASSRVAAGLPPHSISVVSADALLADLNEDGSQEGNGEDFPYDDEDTLHHVRFVDQYALDLLTEHEQNSPARLGHPGLSLHIRINGGNSTGRTDRPHHLSYYHSPRAGYSLTPRLPAEVNGTPRTAHGHGFHPHAHRHSIHAEGVDKQSEKV